MAPRPKEKPQPAAKSSETALAMEPMAVYPYLIKHVLKETHDTFTLELSPERSTNSFNFLPGQFNMLYVFGVGEVPISISGDPAKSESLIQIGRAHV